MRQLLTALVLSILLMQFVPFARGQAATRSPAATASPTPAAETSPTNSPVSEPKPIPLAEVVAQAESVQSMLRDINAGLAEDQITTTVDSELPLLVQEIDSRLEENRKILNSRPSLDTLRRLENEWSTLTAKPTKWTRDLTTRATALDDELGRLTELVRRWELTLKLAQAGTTGANDQPDDATVTATPPEIIQRIEATIAAIKQTRTEVEKRRAQVLSLQDPVAEQATRINTAVEKVHQARDETVNQLFVRDSPPIWSREVLSRAGENLIQDSQTSFSTQWVELKTYVKRHWVNFVVHLIVLLFLIAALYWARRRVQPWVLAEPSLESVLRVFYVPVPTALVISLLGGGWIYPQAPRLLTAILGAAALIPTVIILRKLIDRPFSPILNTLVVFYFVDQLQLISAALPVLSRLLFLLEMVGGFVFLVWVIKSDRLNRVPETERDRLWKVANFSARVATVVFLMSALANVLGYVSLANLAGNALLRSAYLALILFATIRIADGLIMLALRVRPLALLGMVKHHRPLFRPRIRRVLRWIAIITWALFTLELLSLRAPVLKNIRLALDAQLRVGDLHISLGNVLAFVLTIWFAFLLSKFLRFLLKEDVYPHIKLARGVPYAISTVLNYLILLVGFLFAVAALGIDMTKFTILAGAFGVGLGFGLQNIVNNFVSGVVLLFERPVNVGDMIQVGQRDGVLRRVGMRASVIRTLEGSEVIVPNGQLISEEVLNWTLSDQQRRLEINVGVAYGTDPEMVIELLTKVALKHPDILKEPSPDTLFVEFGDSALNFKLRAWTSSFERWIQIRSELSIGVNRALREAGISIPFPQRDLHIQTSGNGEVTINPGADQVEESSAHSASNVAKTKSPGKKN